MHRSDLYDRINLRMACKEQYKETFYGRICMKYCMWKCIDFEGGVCKKRKRRKKRRPVFLNNDSKVRLGFMKFANML